MRKRIWIYRVCAWAAVMAAVNAAVVMGQSPGRYAQQAPDAMRELSFAQIQSCARGTAAVVLTKEGITFQRFRPELLEYYAKKGETSAVRSLCPAGVALRFVSDTRRIEVDAVIEPDTPAAAGQIDLLYDGVHVGAFRAQDKKGSVAAAVVLTGAAGQERTIELYLSHYSHCAIKAVRIQKGARFAAAPARGVLLALGDSITQGGGAYGPAQAAAHIAARTLGLDVHNGGIGGYYFDAGSLLYPIAETPALILVAYGTNDWNAGREAANARVFLKRLRVLWPEVKVVVLEPLYRFSPDTDGDGAVNKAGITLADYRRELREIVAEFDNMVCISAGLLLGPDASLFSDGVHPSPAGHLLYGQNLARILSEYRPLEKN